MEGILASLLTVLLKAFDDPTTAAVIVLLLSMVALFAIVSWVLLRAYLSISEKYAVLATEFADKISAITDRSLQGQILTADALKEIQIVLAEMKGRLHI